MAANCLCIRWMFRNELMFLYSPRLWLQASANKGKDRFRENIWLRQESQSPPWCPWTPPQHCGPAGQVYAHLCPPSIDYSRVQSRLRTFYDMAPWSGCPRVLRATWGVGQLDPRKFRVRCEVTQKGWKFERIILRSGAKRTASIFNAAPAIGFVLKRPQRDDLTFPPAETLIKLPLSLPLEHQN